MVTQEEWQATAEVMQRISEIGGKALEAVARAQFTEEQMAKGMGFLDTKVTVGALIMAIAMIIEAGDNMDTPRDLRLAADEVRTRLHDFLKLLRHAYQSNGIHALEEFGGRVQKGELQ